MVRGLKPLNGRRVLELCGLLPCPMMGLILSDLGAEVLKIEGPKGDMVRNVPPFAYGKGLMYHALNRGKQVIRLDLRDKKQHPKFLELVKDYDIVLEGFRPGFLEEKGLGPEFLNIINPGLLVLRMSAFGQDASDRPAHDLNLMGIAGALGLSDSIHPMPIQAADMTSAVLGALTVLASIMDKRTGVLDLPLIAGAHMASFPLYTRFTDKGDLKRENLLLEGGYPLYRMYETRDNKRISIAAIEPGFVQNILNCTGLEGPEEEGLKKWFQQHDLNEVTEIFSKAPACVEPVNMPWEASGHYAMKTLFAPMKAGDGYFMLPLTPFVTPEEVPQDGPWVED